MRIIEKMAINLIRDIAFPELAAQRKKRPKGDLRDFVRKHYDDCDNNGANGNRFFKSRGRVNKMAEENKVTQNEPEQKDTKPEKAGEGEETMKEVDKLKKDLDSLRKDMKDLTSSVKSLTTAKATSAKDRVWKAASDIEDRAEGYVTDAYDTVRDHGERYIKMGRDQIQSRPLTSALWIFGAGFLLGKLFDRR